jgi:hypothetical protein
VRKEILEATLCSDLIGFHTYDYARHFIQSCAYLLDGIEISANGLYVNAHHAVVGAFPVGIEPDKFEKQLQTTETQTRVRFYLLIPPPHSCLSSLFYCLDQRVDEVLLWQASDHWRRPVGLHKGNTSQAPCSQEAVQPAS